MERHRGGVEMTTEVRVRYPRVNLLDPEGRGRWWLGCAGLGWSGGCHGAGVSWAGGELGFVWVWAIAAQRTVRGQAARRDFSLLARTSPGT